MKNKLFIWIDFSKKIFDVSVLHQDNLYAITYQQFENTKESCLSFLKWVASLMKESRNSWLFCGEHTGLYSIFERIFSQERLDGVA